MTEKQVSELVKRLMDIADDWVISAHMKGKAAIAMREAAALITAQAVDIKRLRTALKPVVCACEGRCSIYEWLPSDTGSCVYAKARAALNPPVLPMETNHENRSRNCDRTG